MFVSVIDHLGQPIDAIQKALDAYMPRELVELTCADSESRCRRCGCIRLWKEHVVSSHPAVLMVAFNRWTDAQHPLLHPIHISEDVVFHARRYYLRSVVIHLGASAQVGHYVAVVKHATGHGNWWFYDDARRVQALPEQISTLCSYRHYGAMHSYIALYEAECR